MTNDEVTIKGTLILARQNYLQQCWGADVLREAKLQVEREFGGLAILSATWYPRNVLTTLENSARLFGKGAVQFSKKKMGCLEAKHLLSGPYTHLSRETPEKMAITMPILFSCIYRDLTLSCDRLGKGTCEFLLRGAGLRASDMESYEGFFEEALTIAKGRKVSAVAKINGKAEEMSFSVHWEAEGKVNGREVVNVNGEFGIMDSRGRAMEISKQMGFGSVDLVNITTFVSELARNIVYYAGEGIITLEDTVRQGERCLMVKAEDRGPGISNIDDILNGSYKSSKGMGMGLKAVRKLADEFNVESRPGEGTTVEVCKYLKKR